MKNSINNKKLILYSFCALIFLTAQIQLFGYKYTFVNTIPLSVTIKAGKHTIKLGNAPETIDVGKIMCPKKITATVSKDTFVNSGAITTPGVTMLSNKTAEYTIKESCRNHLFHIKAMQGDRGFYTLAIIQVE